MKTKIISILALLLTVTQGAWAQTNTHSSEGYIEILSGQNGSIHIHGWARDQDCPNTPIDVDIYVFSNSDGTGQVISPITTKANIYHGTDVGYHAFSTEVELPNTTQTTYYVRAWALETNSAGERLGGGCQMTIAGQSAATIHAVTVNAPFAVTYNANEGTGAPSTQYKRTSFNLTLSSTQPTRTGYTFAGWNTAADGTGTDYAAGATYSANADLTLYAQWTHHTTSGIDWNPSANSGTFLMPAYNVEVSTELWYLVDEEKTLDENIAAYGTKSDFFLNRTLTADVWNTFASPFAIAAGDMTKYFGEGAKVRQLSSTSVAENVLTLNFTNATEIVAGQPYLVKPAANVDFSADGKEFAGVDLIAASATPTATTYVNFVPTLGKTAVTGNVKDILILNTSGTLVHPSAVGNMKGFRGYFVMNEAAGAREFIMNFGDGETTGIQPIRMENGTTPAEGTYDLSGRRIQGQPTQKGVYIQNGKKEIIK